MKNKKLRTSTSWEKRFDKEFPNAIYADLTIKGITTRFNAIKEVKEFIRIQKEKSVRETITAIEKEIVGLQTVFQKLSKKEYDKKIMIVEVGTDWLVNTWWKKVLSSLNSEGED